MRKDVKHEGRTDGRTDGRTGRQAGMAKPIVAIYNFRKYLTKFYRNKEKFWGSSVAQTVRCLFLTADVCFQSQVTPYRVCGGQRVAVTGLVFSE
jgi:hypothetical protein